MSQLKFSLKIWNNILIGGGTGSLGPSLGYALAQDLKKRSRAEKIRPVMPILPSHAEIMPVTEKNLIITDFLVKFCFSSKIKILRTKIWLRPKLGF